MGLVRELSHHTPMVEILVGYFLSLSKLLNVLNFWVISLIIYKNLDIV